MVIFPHIHLQGIHGCPPDFIDCFAAGLLPLFSGTKMVVGGLLIELLIIQGDGVYARHYF
jgi:hypothetical protein